MAAQKRVEKMLLTTIHYLQMHREYTYQPCGVRKNLILRRRSRNSSCIGKLLQHRMTQYNLIFQTLLVDFTLKIWLKTLMNIKMLAKKASIALRLEVRPQIWFLSNASPKLSENDSHAAATLRSSSSVKCQWHACKTSV